METRRFRYFKSVKFLLGLLIICMISLLFTPPALAAVQSWPWVMTDCDHDSLQDDGKLTSQTITIQTNTQVCVVPPSYMLDSLRIYTGVYIAGQYFPETSSETARCKTVSSSTVNIYSSTICTVQPGRLDGTITYTAVTPTACPCNSCADCMTKLSSPSCSIVELTADIIDQEGMCINNPTGFIGKVFDCKGHIIDGDNTGIDFGIYLPSGGGNTIRNCIITEFDGGIFFDWQASGNTVADNQISKNRTGVDLFNAGGTTVINNRISENTYIGVRLGGIASYNSVIANEILDNVSYGVLIQQSSESRGNTFTSNNICSFRGWDILDQNYSPYSSPPSRPNTGDNNICHDDRAFWKDTSGDAGCRYECAPPTAGCVGATRTFFCGDTVTESCTLSGSMTVCGSSVPPCLQVETSGITIDCNGYSITGFDLPTSGLPPYGIFSDYSTVKTGTTIKNCVIDGFNEGAIVLYSSPSATLTNNIVRSSGMGIYLATAGGSTLTNNKANSNRYYGILLYSSPNCVVDGNTANSNRSFTDSTGIALSSSNNVNLSNNSLSSNRTGIGLGSSSNCSLINNSVTSSEHYGIRLVGSSYNTIRRNSVSLTSLFDGIAISNSNSNLIYDNLFNNWSNVSLYSSVNTWNTSRTSGTNVVEGPYLGGNFWTNPSAGGFSDTCQDGNYDGICDAGYTLSAGNVDYLPLKRPVPPNTPVGQNVPVSDSGTGALITFSDVTAPGVTTVIGLGTGPSIPGGFMLASLYFDIMTTAVYSGNIEICLPYDESIVGSEENLRLMHWNGTAWEDVTTSLNAAGNVICGIVPSLSIFAVMESIAQIEAIVDFAPDALNLGSKGKWVTVYIELPADHYASEIIVSSTRLNGVARAEESPTDIGDYDDDGVMDLMLKFSRSSVEAVVSPGESVITVTGEMSDGTAFSGTDTIRVIE